MTRNRYVCPWMARVLAAGLTIWLSTAAAARDGAGESPGQLCQDAMTSWRGRRRDRLAEPALRRCLDTDSTYYDAYPALASLYMRHHQGARAESVLVRGLRLAPEHLESLLTYSQLLDRQGRKAEAYARLREVVALAPGTAAAWKGIGYLRMEPDPLLDLGEAVEAFDRASEIDPDDLEALFNAGKARMYRGDADGAAAAFREILERVPSNYPARYQLGMTRYLRGAYSEARRELERAAALAPESAVTRWSLYWAAEGAGGYSPDVPDSLRLSPPAQSAAATGIRFTDVAAQMGVDRLDAGRGSAWADVDGDGDLDLFSMGHFAGVSLYANRGEEFVDQWPDSGVDVDPGMGSLFADYDNDGDPDLYITRDGWYGRAANSLLRNRGDGRFVEVSDSAGVADRGSSFTACWGDVDVDGILDLFVADGVSGDGSPNRLFLGSAEGRFRDVAGAAGIRPGRSIGSALGDYDNDGDLDLYVVDFDALNTFYRNDTQGGAREVRFHDETRSTRTQLPVGGYFAFFFDYDNDGFLDLFCTQMSGFQAALYSREHGRTRRNGDRPALYHNEGNGGFRDVTYVAGLGRAYGSVGGHWGDFNSDGLPDIYLGNGGASMTRLEPDALLLNLGGGRFEDITAAAGIQQLGKAHGVTFADYDGDGDQDIYVPVGGTYPGDLWRNHLFRNDSDRRSWIVVRLTGSRSNRDGIGARVRVLAGGVTRHSVVSSGGGFGAGNSLQVEMGLDEARRVTELEVRWPSGQVDLLEDVPVNGVVEVVEGGGQR